MARASASRKHSARPAPPRKRTNLLANRLRYLEAAGVLRRVLAPSPQSAVVYELTERGHALRPAVDALEAWGKGSPQGRPGGPASMSL